MLVVLPLTSLSSGVRLAIATVVFFFVFSFLTFLSLRFLSTVVNTVLPSHSWSSSPLFPSTFWASDPLASFCRRISTYYSPISSKKNFLSLQPPLSVRPFFSYPLSSLHESSYPVGLQSCTVSCGFSVSAFISNGCPNCYPHIALHPGI